MSSASSCSELVAFDGLGGWVFAEQPDGTFAVDYEPPVPLGVRPVPMRGEN